jgi:putative PIN family toxin of toxin-antitoxin system
VKRVVIDTNVLVSALLSHQAPPARILEAALQGELQACLSTPMMREYSDVLARPKFHFDPTAIRIVLAQLQSRAMRLEIKPLGLSLPDAKDVIFLEAALAARPAFLVTGNMRHFPAKACRGVEVISPSRFSEKHLQ